MANKHRLIELVREREVLWDKRNEQYHNRALRASLWDEVGEALKIRGEEARKSWELLRDTYRRIISKGKGLSRPSIKYRWIYFNDLDFLYPMIGIKASSCNNSSPDVIPMPDSDEIGGFSITTNDFEFSTDHRESQPEEITEVGNAWQSETTPCTSYQALADRENQRHCTKRKQARALSPYGTDDEILDNAKALGRQRRKCSMDEALSLGPEGNQLQFEDDKARSGRIIDNLHLSFKNMSENLQKARQACSALQKDYRLNNEALSEKRKRRSKDEDELMAEALGLGCGPFLETEVKVEQTSVASHEDDEMNDEALSTTEKEEQENKQEQENKKNQKETKERRRNVNLHPSYICHEFHCETRQTCSAPKEDDDLLFLKSLLPSLKKLPHIRRMKLRSTILNSVISELENVETNHDRPQQAPNDSSDGDE